MKHKCQTIFIGLFCVLILIFPNIAIKSVRDTLSLWATSVVPALFPFSVAMNILIALHTFDYLSLFFQKITKKFFGFSGHFSSLFFASALSGYPVGAKLTVDLYQQKSISKKQAEALLGCVSTSGPMFILGSVCINMLGNHSFAKYLLWPHYLSALFICLISGKKYSKTPDYTQSILAHFSQKNPLDFGNIFAKVISSCIQSMLTVCGFMVIYAVYVNTLAEVFYLIFQLPITTSKTIMGILEMTTGCANSQILTPSLRLIYLSFLISFGGFAIYSQTSALASKAELRPKHFLVHKSIHGILSASLTAIVLKIFPLDASCFYQTPTLSFFFSETSIVWLSLLCILLCLWQISYHFMIKH